MPHWPQKCAGSAATGIGGSVATDSSLVRNSTISARGPADIALSAAPATGRHATRVCGADAERSVFFDHYLSRDPSLTLDCGSRIEGIGRPRVEPSFIPSLVERMDVVSNLESVAAMHALTGLLGRKVGPSTGTNFVAMLRLANEMRAAQTPGSVLSLLCDAGERYEKTYHDASWVKAQFGDTTPARHHLATLLG